MADPFKVIGGTGGDGGGRAGAAVRALLIRFLQFPSPPRSYLEITT